MSAEVLSEWLTSLQLPERTKALNLLSFKLTINAREHGIRFSDPDALPATAKRLLGISELHHKLLSQIGHYLDGEETGAYPVDVFSRILFEVANQHDCTADLNAAIRSARGQHLARR